MLESCKVKKGFYPCLIWEGYFVGKFTKEDLMLLKDLQEYKEDIDEQFEDEEQMKNESINSRLLGIGLSSLDDRQTKFYEDLWTNKVYESDLEIEECLVNQITTEELLLKASAQEASDMYR